MLFHGAGTHRDHPLVRRIASALGAAGLPARTVDFPFRARGPRHLPRPSDTAGSLGAVRTAVPRAAAAHTVLAGHSYGARMIAAAAPALCPAVAGHVLCAFPLHGRRGPAPEVVAERTALLAALPRPTLILAGTRDAQARSPELEGAVEAARGAGAPVALVRLGHADHGFSAPVRSGAEPLAELAEAVRSWRLRTFPDPAGAPP